MRGYNRNDFFKFLIESIPEDDFLTEEQALKYLLALNKTRWTNITANDIFDYEKIIYIENRFKDNYKIQNLIDILKENIAKNYKLKQQYLLRILDQIKDSDTTFNNCAGFFMDDV